ncbi:hypothetical protein O2K51_02570 [Apibacter raozihei]|uniref:hypothetical protein n=1 Tax=Apibacter raozihei TaxID=2500547 RepID=UPI000FE43ADA|nr:hypothetical protein [Apibacter raozihei]
MKIIKKLLLCCLSLIISISLVNAQENNNITAQEIVTKSIDAMGGEKYLKSIKTLYTDMSTEMEGRKVNWIVREMIPNKGSFEIKYEGRIVYKNFYDGKNGYEFVRGEKVKADPAKFKDKPYKENIFNELDYLNSDSWKLELIGDGNVDSRSCYKIKASLINGLVKILYFDKETFLTLRSDKIKNAEKDSFTTTIFSDFKKFDDLIHYSKIKVGDSIDFQTITVDEIIINKNILNKDFK